MLKFVNWTLVARRKSVVPWSNLTSVLSVLTTKMMFVVLRYVWRPVDSFASMCLLEVLSKRMMSCSIDEEAHTSSRVEFDDRV